MKKVLVGIMAIGLVGLASASMACYDNSCTGFGNLDIKSISIGGGKSFGVYTVPGGIAFGGGKSFGTTAGYGTGSVVNGEVWGDVHTYGGGFSKTEEYTVPGVPVSVGSRTDNYATTGGSLDMGVKTDRWGLGGFSGVIGGTAFQKSGNVSGLFAGGPGWSSVGATGGFAGQQSDGWFSGGVYGGAAGKGGKSEAGVEADISMSGGSWSGSYRYTDGSTQGMGTNVGAYTNITSSGSKYSKGPAGSYLNGGFGVSGVAKTATVQFSPNGFAGSGAIGSYSVENCKLGNNYEGSAIGYSYTAMTTGPGNGVISSAGAGMKVSSRLITN